MAGIAGQWVRFVLARPQVEKQNWSRSSYNSRQSYMLSSKVAWPLPGKLGQFRRSLFCLPPRPGAPQDQGSFRLGAQWPSLGVRYMAAPGGAGAVLKARPPGHLLLDSPPHPAHLRSGNPTSFRVKVGTTFLWRNHSLPQPRSPSCMQAFLPQVSLGTFLPLRGQGQRGPPPSLLLGCRGPGSWETLVTPPSCPCRCPDRERAGRGLCLPGPRSGDLSLPSGSQKAEGLQPHCCPRGCIFKNSHSPSPHLLFSQGAPAFLPLRGQGAVPSPLHRQDSVPASTCSVWWR